jgi:hypothetical protein
VSVVSLSVTLRREEVLRFLGYPEQKQPGQRIDALLDEVIEEAREAVCRAAYSGLTRSNARRSLAEPIGPRLWWSVSSRRGAIEQRARELVASGDARGLLMDAAAAPRWRDRRSPGCVIAAENRPPAHFGVSCRISPATAPGRFARRSACSRRCRMRSSAYRCCSMLMSPEVDLFAMWLGADRRPLADCRAARCGSSPAAIGVD